MNIQYKRENNAIPALTEEAAMISFLEYVAKICVDRIIYFITQVAISELPRQIYFVTLGLSGVIGKMIAYQLIDRAEVQVSVPNFIGNKTIT